MSPEDLSLQKTFRYLEWIAIFLVTLQQITWVNNAVQYHFLIGVSFAFLGLTALLSAILPKNPRWLFAHLLVQSAVISVAWALGAPKRTSIYFLVLGAKAAALLSRGQMIFVAAILVVQRIACGTLSLHLASSHFYMRRAREANFYTQVMPEAEAMLFFIAGLVTMLFLGRTLAKARRSRMVQQALAKEAESLAVDLERNKIASDINASLGHTLASQMIQLELAFKLVQDKKLDKARELVTKSYDSSVHCLQELRRAVKAIRTEDEKVAERDGATAVDVIT